MKDIYVVKVIDDYTVVLNVGAKDGIGFGQRFMIYTIDKEELFDPVTKESLGYAELSKGRGKADMVTETTCTVTSTGTRTRTRTEKPDDNVYSSNTMMSFLTGVNTKITEYNESSQEPFKSPRVGDRAKIIN